MASERWTWDAKTRRYRDGETGRLVSKVTVQAWRDELIESQAKWAGNLASMVSDGRLTPAAFERECRERIKRLYTAEFLLGRGGRNAWTASDRGAVGAVVKEQYRFLRGFVEEIAEGGLSQAAVESRAALYFASSRQAFERGKGRAFGMPDLPTYPADGSQQCVANCKCYWDIRELDDRWEATWQLSAGTDHCETCEGNATRYAPLIIPKE